MTRLSGCSAYFHVVKYSIVAIVEENSTDSVPQGNENTNASDHVFYKVTFA